ncbi:MAG TPA: hypothetical protein PKL31_11470 [Fulvivirga sp.]|nr:hypothetical protein [Fulvivirga sp.]
MKIACCLSLFFSCIVSYSLAGEIVLTGSYQGKDIFVQNPFNKASDAFCTESVFVNDRQLYDHPNVSAYKIDLSFLNMGDLVVIRITYSDGCKPTIVNSQVLKAPQSFQFLTAQADNNSITWTTRGEIPGGVYYTEHQWKNKDWAVVDTIRGKGSFEINKYAVPPAHLKGENNYRIRYDSFDQKTYYSMEFLYTAADTYITFYPHIASSQLVLSDSTDYVITDFYGKVVKKGSGRDILLLGLKPGKYFLNIQNRQEQFIKR